MMKTYTDTATAVLNKMNWPDKTIESWRRTPIRLLDPMNFKEPVSAESLLTPSEIPFEETSGLLQFAGTKILKNEQGTSEGGPAVLSLEEGVRKYPSEKEFFFPGEWADRFEAWNNSETTHSLFLDFPRGKVLEKPFVLRLDSLSRDHFSAPRIFVRLGENWQGSLVIVYSGSEDGQDKELVNSSLRIWAGQNSHVKIAEIQTLGLESRLVQNTQILLERDAQVKHSQFQIGAGAIKTNTVFHLKGEGAELQAEAIYTSGKNQHKDIRLEQRHFAPHTTSRALYKGAVSRRGRSVFQGMIIVEHEAPGTDAYLSNKNLILTKGSRADAIPGLKILVDDVKCSHGSTTGKLDPAQLFYLMSRGIPKTEAVRILTEGMFEELIAGHPELPAEWLRDRIARSLEPGEDLI
jgi:Fe-S cluster assembly protein SufD